MPPRIFIICSGFLVGVALAQKLGFGFALAALFLLLALIFFIWVGFSSDRTKFFLVTALVFLSLGIGAARFSWQERNSNTSLVPLVGKEVEFLGTVVAEPDGRESYTRLVFHPDKTRVDILLSVPSYSNIQYGDRLQVAGRLERPENFQTDTGREFDYVGYLAKDDIYFQIWQPTVEELGERRANWLKGSLYWLKGFWRQRVNQLIVEPEASLLAGIVVGARQGLGKSLQRVFRQTGLIHLVVLSGYNVTVVTEGILRGLVFLAPWWRFGFGSLAIFLFAIMTGAGPTVVRASLMAFLALLARQTGRVYGATLALLSVAAAMVFYNPKILLGDVGFQLSFLSTLGLIYFMPMFEARLRFVPERFGLRAIVASTLSAQVAVLPWLLFQIGEFSLVALPANLLVVPLIPAVMLLGFLIGFFWFVPLYFLTPFSWLVFVLLAYILAAADFFAALPFASFRVTVFPWWVVSLVYIFYGWFIYRWRQNQAKIKK